MQSLQVFQPDDGKWYDVAPLEHAFVINTGDVMQVRALLGRAGGWTGSWAGTHAGLRRHSSWPLVISSRSVQRCRHVQPPSRLAPLYPSAPARRRGRSLLGVVQRLLQSAAASREGAAGRGEVLLALLLQPELPVRLRAR